MTEQNVSLTPPPFVPFPKIARLSRDIVVTEKLDGTNASVLVTEEGAIFAGSRTRWLTAEADNFGFARWVAVNASELLRLGPGHHFGEWWGSGIQRGYGLTKGDKRFSLFNTAKWGDAALRPTCCGVVPVLYKGRFETAAVEGALGDLRREGSQAAPGFMNPEGVVVFHAAGNLLLKKTLVRDEEPKGLAR